MSEDRRHEQTWPVIALYRASQSLGRRLTIPTFTDPGSEYRTEPVSPEPRRFTADVDAASEYEILYQTQ